MKLIIGLGNPGEKYEHTRHNLGFQAVDHFLKDVAPVQKTWSFTEKLKSDIVLLNTVILAKPRTYMNNSGMGVQLLASFYKIAPEDIWIVYDELDLPVGFMKIRFGGAAAGHHGVESIMKHLGTDQFWRFRLGIGVSHPHIGRAVREDGKAQTIGGHQIKDAEDFVLGAFGSSEQGKIRELIKHASDALQMAIEKGMDAAMNRYNTK